MECGRHGHHNLDGGGSLAADGWFAASGDVFAAVFPGQADRSRRDGGRTKPNNARSMLPRRLDRAAGGPNRQFLPILAEPDQTDTRAGLNSFSLIWLTTETTDMLQGRRAPVPGRSNLKSPTRLGNPCRLKTMRPCCARGRLLSAVVHLAASAVISLIWVNIA